MSLNKLSWASPEAQEKVHEDLGKLEGKGIFKNRATQAQSIHSEHIKNVAELKAADEAHKAARGKVNEGDLLAKRQEASAKVQASGKKLGGVINPGGHEAVVAGRAKVHSSVPIPKTPVVAEKAGEGILSKVKNFAMEHPKAAGGIAAGTAAVAYGAHKLLQRNRERRMC